MTENTRPIETDEALMVRFQSDDEEAFKMLFDRYSKRLINFAYRFLFSQEEAEDVAQRVLLTLYQKKSRYDPQRPFRPWLFSIASRLMSNRLRDRKRHPHVSLDYQSDEDSSVGLAHNIPDASSPSSDRVAEKREVARAVQTALAVLPENQHAAVVLSRFEDLSYEEIAQVMDTSISTVKSLLFRARQTLKKELESYVSAESAHAKKE